MRTRRDRAAVDLASFSLHLAYGCSTSSGTERRLNRARITCVAPSPDREGSSPPVREPVVARRGRGKREQRAVHACLEGAARRQCVPGCQPADQQRAGSVTRGRQLGTDRHRRRQRTPGPRATHPHRLTHRRSALEAGPPRLVTRRRSWRSLGRAGRSGRVSPGSKSALRRAQTDAARTRPPCPRKPSLPSS